VGVKHIIDVSSTLPIDLMDWPNAFCVTFSHVAFLNLVAKIIFEGFHYWLDYFVALGWIPSLLSPLFLHCRYTFITYSTVFFLPCLFCSASLLRTYVCSLPSRILLRSYSVYRFCHPFSFLPLSTVPVASATEEM